MLASVMLNVRLQVRIE
ncbi:hypothetical protein LEMLEM_LOCUS17374 [Lemmus lemmus]